MLALAIRPAVVLAEEPTGHLDPETADRVLSLFFDLQAYNGTALVVVTHDPTLTERLDRTLRLSDVELVLLYKGRTARFLGTPRSDEGRCLGRASD